MGLLHNVVRQHFEEIDSTHLHAKRHICALEKGTLLLTTATVQTSGRGRYGRQWISAPGENLLATFSFRIDNKRKDSGNIPQILALSICSLLDNFNISAQLKWPNDVLVSKKKIAGVLATSSQLDSSDDVGMIVSTGLNVSMQKNALDNIGQPATSIYMEHGKHENIEVLAETLAANFLHDINTFLTSGFIPFLDNYRKRMFAQPGDSVRFHFNEELLEGRFQEITSAGTLKLDIPNRGVTEFASGEFLYG